MSNQIKTDFSNMREVVGTYRPHNNPRREYFQLGQLITDGNAECEKIYAAPREGAKLFDQNERIIELETDNVVVLGERSDKYFKFFEVPLVGPLQLLSAFDVEEKLYERDIGEPKDEGRVR